MDLVIGNGLIGRNLYYRIRGGATITSRKELDLSREGWELPRCETAYICAAETSTVKCEAYPNETRLVNVTNTVLLAEKLLKYASVIFLSSERVFDGREPFRKITDKVCPITEYGRQKAEVERELLARGVTIIRLSKVLGWNEPLFDGWIERLKIKGSIFPHSNKSMAPLPVQFVSEVIEKIGKQKMMGLYQLSALTDISYDRIAYHICNYMNMDMNLVQPVEVKEGHKNTTLDSGDLIKSLGLNIPDSWETIYRWCKDAIPRRT